jgi:hypothetical protein
VLGATSRPETYTGRYSGLQGVGDVREGLPGPELLILKRIKEQEHPPRLHPVLAATIPNVSWLVCRVAPGRS